MQSLSDRILALELALGEQQDQPIADSLQELKLYTQKLVVPTALQAALKSCPIEMPLTSTVDINSDPIPLMKETVLAAATQLSHCISQLETVLAYKNTLDALAATHESLAAATADNNFPTLATLCARHSEIVRRYSITAQRLLRLLEQAALSK